MTVTYMLELTREELLALFNRISGLQPIIHPDERTLRGILDKVLSLLRGEGR